MWRSDARDCDLSKLLAGVRYEWYDLLSNSFLIILRFWTHDSSVLFNVSFQPRMPIATILGLIPSAPKSL